MLCAQDAALLFTFSIRNTDYKCIWVGICSCALTIHTHHNIVVFIKMSTYLLTYLKAYVVWYMWMQVGNRLICFFLHALRLLEAHLPLNVNQYVCAPVCVCVFKDHWATWVGLYLWVCRQCVPVDTSRPSTLMKLFSLPSGYWTEWGCLATLSHFSV